MKDYEDIWKLYVELEIMYKKFLLDSGFFRFGYWCGLVIQFQEEYQLDVIWSGMFKWRLSCVFVYFLCSC